MPMTKLPTGIDLYYEVHGEGQPVVFIPGTGLACDVWRPFQTDDFGQDHQVIIFDPRGCGRSSRPFGVYTIEQMALDTICLLDHLDIKSAHIVGHSMGGRIGLSMALDAPGRVASLVMAASGSGPAARTGPDCVPGLPFFLVDPLVEMGLDKMLEHEFIETDTYFTGSFREHEPGFVQSFYKRAVENHADRSSYIRLCQARHMFEATHRLGDVAVPTLILIGGEDTIGSNHVTQAEALRRIPDSEYVFLENQSHGFFWQQPEKSNAIVGKWVADHASE